MGVSEKIKALFKRFHRDSQFKDYIRKYRRFSFVDCACKEKEQFDASIIRLYHTIEKGLSYADYRPGFGEENVKKLIATLEQYSQKYGCQSFSYDTALSCLLEYVSKNKEYGYNNPVLETKISNLPGVKNDYGGTILISKPSNPNTMSYEELIKSRHSIRQFSKEPVEQSLIVEAIKLAQYTPSACNRQSWNTRIICNKDLMKKVLSNQNGNRGFGQELDKLLLITSDLRAQQREREKFQAYIDGGMYAANLLNALFAKGIGSIPLSASLTTEQEQNIRKCLKIKDAEVLILFIGIGNYPEGSFLTTKSTRKPIEIEML